MEIRLFKPVTDALIIKLYADDLVRITGDEASKSAFQLELSQLRAALENRGVDPKIITPTPMDSEELARIMLAVHECYRDAAPDMSDEELDAYYVRLTLTGLEECAAAIEEEMNRRGLVHSSPEAIKAARTDLEEAAEAKETHRQVVDENLHSFLINAYRARKDPDFIPPTPLVN